MARRRMSGNLNLSLLQGGAIPIGMRETCAGCLGPIDLREGGWVVLADKSMTHGGEACWRKAVEREETSRRRPTLISGR